jgi:hypothetical protein
MKVWLFGTIILVLAGAAYLITRWWRHGGGRQLLLSLPFQNWPDFKKWDRRSEFKLEEAAALWFDAEPRSPMWWRTRWKLRRLRAAIPARVGASHPRPRSAAELGRRPAPVTSDTTVHRDTLRALAEKEDVHPLFPYPEFRFRSQGRDGEADKARLASIYESVRSAISNVESEIGGLQARLEYARQSAATLLTTTGRRSEGEPGEAGRARVEVRLLAPERRMEELKRHLATLRRIENAVSEELNS